MSNPNHTAFDANGRDMTVMDNPPAQKANTSPAQKAGEKPSNPKDAMGVNKVAFSTLSMPVIAEMAVGMTEGGMKYGRHNYRNAGIRASVYYDAAMRHLTAWWEGEDIDKDSGLSHIAKAMTTLMVLRDAQLRDMVTDDRPPSSEEWMGHLNHLTAALRKKYPNPKPAITLNDVPPAMVLYT